MVETVIFPHHSSHFLLMHFYERNKRNEEIFKHSEFFVLSLGKKLREGKNLITAQKMNFLCLNSTKKKLI